MTTVPHVVIVGGGFAGLYAARGLRKAAARVTLLDRRNYHLFQPLLYQVASAALNPSDIAAPIRSILRDQKNVTVILGEVIDLDPAARTLRLADGATMGYDYLVLATGATHSYFAHPEWAENAPGLKTIEDALEIRRRILLAFESAERSENAEERMALLTFIVIGAGPTGVELAGALSEIARDTMVRDFRRIRPENARVILVEGRDRVLPSYAPDLSEKARIQLEKLGVEVLVNATVSSVTGQDVTVGAQTIPARTVLWAAGVQASPLARSLGVPLDRAGRVQVEQDLTIPGNANVYVIGDLAAAPLDGGTSVPGVAPAAMQEGSHTARNITRQLQGHATIPFRYVDKGSLATIGRAAAVADLRGAHLSGLIAWVAWLAIHIFFLIGFRNRILVILQWAWAYVTNQRGARLITSQPSDPDHG